MRDLDTKFHIEKSQVLNQGVELRRLHSKNRKGLKTEEIAIDYTHELFLQSKE